MALIKCTECGGKVSDQADACIHCGYPLHGNADVQYCTYCGKKNMSNAEFCANCGSSLSNEIANFNHANSTDNNKYNSKMVNIMDLTRVSSNDTISIQREQLCNKKLSAEGHSIQDKAHARCPKCGSISLSSIKQGFGYGKALVGSLLIGDIGLLAGGVGANKVVVICMRCGYKFSF